MNVAPSWRWIGAQLQLHVLAELEVERREGLVEQQDLGLGRQRPGERRALDLAAGQLGRPARAETLEPDEREQLFHPSRRCAPSASAGA